MNVKNKAADMILPEIGQEFWSRIAELRIAVVGDMMLDTYVWGSCSRISPEAPVPVVTVERENTSLGGAGNVINNLLGLGANPVIFSTVGEDHAGEQIQAILKASEVPIDNLLISPSRPTTEKTRILARHQQVARIDRENTTPVNQQDATWLQERFQDTIPNIHGVILSDYRKGLLTDAFAHSIISTASQEKIPIFIDSKAEDYRIFTGATCITPNAAEASMASGIQVTDDEDAVRAGKQINEMTGIPNILITRGSQGMTLVNHQGATHLPTIAQQVYDVSGAGDTVVTTLATGVVAGLDWVPAAQLANLAAGIVVGKAGTVPINSAELVNALTSGLPNPGS
ncbi:MAG: D-glycero-beta-D-manno-heptose-7-phosphate kinase [Fidelibacterota bacterium]|nr:MAG: D-glycero-beta-D-manno-heptose-7-phosphate kinase [Candidatus Neomarinimicrobiota bacterium]